MKKITNSQILALKKFIALSEDASDFAKKVAIFLIGKSGNLEKFVNMKIDTIEKKDQEDIVYGIQNMNSSSNGTRLDLFMSGTGTKLRFYVHGSGICLTDYKSTKFKEIKFDKKKINAITLHENS